MIASHRGEGQQETIVVTKDMFINLHNAIYVIKPSFYRILRSPQAITKFFRHIRATQKIKIKEYIDDYKKALENENLLTIIVRGSKYHVAEDDIGNRIQKGVSVYDTEPLASQHADDVDDSRAQYNGQFGDFENAKQAMDNRAKFNFAKLIDDGYIDVVATFAHANEVETDFQRQQIFETLGLHDKYYNVS